MDAREESLEVLREIRTMMDRSGRFLSLSGKAGVYAGCFALAGWLGLHGWLGVSPWGPGFSDRLQSPDAAFLRVFLGVGLSVLAASLATGLWMAVRKAAGRREPLWDAPARQMLWGLMVPCVTGGLYVLTLMVRGDLALVMPATLIFYGLGLVGASRHTLAEVRGLGLAFLLTGLAAMLQPMRGHWYWAFGFGLLHIVYGLWIHWRHER
jgi:hypothetical protein